MNILQNIVGSIVYMRVASPVIAIKAGEEGRFKEGRISLIIENNFLIIPVVQIERNNPFMLHTILSYNFYPTIFNNTKSIDFKTQVYNIESEEKL